MISLHAALIAVAIGAVTVALGQLIIKAAIEPAIAMKQLIGKIAHDLDFFANQLFGDMPKGQEARETFRSEACELRDKLNVMIWYPVFRIILSLPSKKSVREAASHLIGQSNAPANPEPGWYHSHDQEIKRLLRIEH